jgi:outer membrane protein OmpA-like peptidoglycan-associated protein
MRSSTILLPLSSLALVAAGCGAADDKRVCKPILSWASPAYACAVIAEPPPPPPPEPEPVVEPEPEPEPEPERVVVREESIDITEVVQFETGSARLLPESEQLLDEVADAIKRHPEIRKIQVEGHTDSVGGDRYNMRLSNQRATSVRTYLIRQGVEGRRLVAKGFGLTRPIADNDTEDGRFRNRRVEFNILERDASAAAPAAVDDDFDDDDDDDF